jgi:hypothetical protein
MSKEILAQDLNDANVVDQWWLDHVAYDDALVLYHEARKEILKALGAQTYFEKTSWSAEECIKDLQLNYVQYTLLNFFESAYRKMIEAKARL